MLPHCQCRDRAVTFDTGGTILDWHRGFTAALAAAGTRLGATADWPELARCLGIA